MRLRVAHNDQAEGLGNDKRNPVEELKTCVKVRLLKTVALPSPLKRLVGLLLFIGWCQAIYHWVMLDI